MNRIIVVSFLLAFSIASLFAKDTETRKVPAYEAINVCCGVEIYLSEGAHSDLKIEVSHSELLSGLITEVHGNTLNVSYNNTQVKRPKKSYIRIYMSANNLKAIEASSGSDVHSQNVIKAEDILLSASSGADITLELNAHSINCTSSSGSDIILKGTAETASLKATSGSDIDLSNMKVQIVDASASSGSDINVYTVKEINGKASSGSDIIYSGNPGKVNKKQSSGGTVKQK